MDPMVSPLPRLSSGELERYSRHLRMPQVGLTGQQRLKSARVLVVGTGGLGSPAALYLAAAGIGRLGLVEFDSVALSNLQRQVLYDTADVGRPKLWRAKTRLEAQNPEITVVAHEGPLTAANALTVLADYDVVVDGSDNFATRYLVNDACWLLGKPLVHGSIFRFDGQVAVLVPGETGCYRCLFPAPPEQAPNCAEGGVLGVLAGTVGTLQATEALKLVLGLGTGTHGRLMLYDALTLSLSPLTFGRDPACPLCGDAPAITTLSDPVYACHQPPEDAEVSEDWELTVAELQSRLADVILIDVRETLDATALPEARHLPLSTLAAAIPGLPEDRDLVLVCQSGAASAQAVQLLRSAGFSRTWHLRGGLVAWHHLTGR